MWMVPKMSLSSSEAIALKSERPSAMRDVIDLAALSCFPRRTAGGVGVVTGPRLQPTLSSFFPATHTVHKLHF